MTYQPLYRHRPQHRWTNGDLAARVGADLGLPPDDEQKWILDTIYGEAAPDRPSCFEFGVVSPRQNIKTSTLGVAAIADLFVFGVERHLWTAHHGDTLKGTFTDFRAWIGSNREYEDQVTFYEGHQDMSIVHKDTGNTIDFQSRSGKAGRGLTGVKRITLDEALYLEAKHIGAVYPTMLTRPEAQVRIGSSAGLVTSAELRRIRDRGRGGKDHRLGYVEFGAERRLCLHADCTHAVGSDGCALDDRDLWWQASCALWAGRIAEESIADLRRSMPPEEFSREMLSWWEDPPSIGGALDYDRWLTLADAAAQRGERVVFGVDVDEARTASIGVMWQREDGHAQAMLTVTPEGRVDVGLTVSKATERLVELATKWEGPVVLGGPAAALEDDLAAEGVQVSVASSMDFAAASGFIADGLRDGTLHHGSQAALDGAVLAARWRSVGSNGEKAFQLKDAAGVGPLAAVTRAAHGLMTIATSDPWVAFL